MEYIIVDTSSIMFGLSRKIDVFESINIQLGFRPVLSKGILRELRSLSKINGKYKKYAATALALVSKHKPLIESDNGFVDSWILADSARHPNVCTNDMKLKRDLRAKGISVYSISVGGSLK
ncbi:MAG: hypothetical protein M1569_03230 [Candidatus Marsarchaeota archaeon]|nr:hypothetical protein [Candidatus Marsarchaeota archaeon]MCL5413388.1 hypothetical protein [Candidatus Marsarchaeota archaeon]